MLDARLARLRTLPDALADCTSGNVTRRSEFGRQGQVTVEPALECWIWGFTVGDAKEGLCVVNRSQLFFFAQ